MYEITEEEIDREIERLQLIKTERAKKWARRRWAV